MKDRAVAPRYRAWPDVVASAALAACGGGGGDGDAQTWAAITAIANSYRMYYALDDSRRVMSYETWNQSGETRLRWCTGDLQSSWDCRSQEYAPFSSISARFDEHGRPESYSRVLEGFSESYITYSYDIAGRLIEVTNQTDSGPNIVDRHSTLEYDGAGHLAVIRLSVHYAIGPGSTNATYTVPVPSAVPLRATMTRMPAFAPPGTPTENFSIELNADGAGRYTQKVVFEITDVDARAASWSSYTIDDRGYLTRVVSELYQYAPGLTPIIRTEDAWCLEWLPSGGLLSESHCTSGAVDYSIVYPAERAPSAPVTLQPAYQAASVFDLLCLIAAECVDPRRSVPAP